MRKRSKNPFREFVDCDIKPGIDQTRWSMDLKRHPRRQNAWLLLSSASVEGAPRRCGCPREGHRASISLPPIRAQDRCDT